MYFQDQDNAASQQNPSTFSAVAVYNLLISLPWNLKQQIVSILADISTPFQPSGKSEKETPFKHCNYVSVLATYRGNKTDEGLGYSEITRGNW